MGADQSRRGVLKWSATSIAGIGGGSLITDTVRSHSRYQQSSNQVSGRVVSPFGDPLSNTRVEIYPNEGSAEEPIVRAVTDENGDFQLEPFDQSGRFYLLVRDPETGYFSANSDVGGIETNQEVEFKPSNQLLYGPEIATFEDGQTEMLYVSVWRRLLFPIEDSHTDQLIGIELTQLRSDRLEFGMVPSAAFSLTVPEEGVIVDYDGQEGVADFGTSMFLIPDDVPSQEINELDRWHPSYTGIPSLMATAGLYRELTSAIRSEETAEAEVVGDVVNALPGISELLGIGRELGEILGLDEGETRLVLGENVESRSRNIVDTVSGFMSFPTTSAVFYIPVRINNQNEHTFVAEANWSANPLNVDVDRLQFKKEFSISGRQASGDPGQPPQQDKIEFLDCTTVEVTGDFESVVLHWSEYVPGIGTNIEPVGSVTGSTQIAISDLESDDYPYLDQSVIDLVAAYKDEESNDPDLQQRNPNQDSCHEQAKPDGESRETLMIAANGPADYTVTVDGSIEPAVNAGDFSADSDDSVTENENGLIVASDTSGPVDDADGLRFLGDSYLVNGNFEEISLEPESESYETNLYLDGERVPAERLLNGDYSGETHNLIISMNGPTEYRIAVDGDLTPAPESGDFSGDENDTPSENSDGTLTVSDTTGPVESSNWTRLVGDRYTFTGRLSEVTVGTQNQGDEVFTYLNEAHMHQSE